MKRVNIITKDNGVGLSQDIEIIKSVLHDYECKFLDIHSYNYNNADINIFLELLDSRFFRLAKSNVLIPNPEWFFSQWRKWLPYFDLICCKTIDCFNIFRKLSQHCNYTSFTSFDRYDENIKREKEFLHIAGKSSHKNTDAIVSCWRSHPDLPTLHLVKQENHVSVISENIKYYPDPLSKEEITTLLNKCQFHLCPSEYEGFGHYINEARSVGAVIISTDAPPMNELINNNYGKLVKPKKESYMFNLGRCHKIAPGELYFIAKDLYELNNETIQGMSIATREEYNDNDLFFKHEFKRVIDSL